MDDQRAGQTMTEHDGSESVTVLERPQEMPVLSLWQPWAQLVALGLKTIETRSWSTKYRGPLAIHATAKAPPILLKGELGRWDCCDMHYAEGASDYRLTNVNDGTSYPLPLGVIVATCTLLDVVPILGRTDRLDIAWAPHVAPTAQGVLWHWKGPSENANASTGRPTWRHADIEEQRPYGDYTPGRFAWLLADIERLITPVPFKGGQGLTRKWAA